MWLAPNVQPSLEFHVTRLSLRRSQEPRQRRNTLHGAANELIICTELHVIKPSNGVAKSYYTVTF